MTKTPEELAEERGKQQMQTINETEQEEIIKLCQEVIDLKARCDCYEDEIKFLRELLTIKTKGQNENT